MHWKETKLFICENNFNITVNLTILFLNRPEDHSEKVKSVGQISILGNFFSNNAITRTMTVYIKSKVYVVLYIFVSRLSYLF